jgi:uncharacterized protein YlxW (UPF0749 family)
MSVSALTQVNDALQTVNAQVTNAKYQLQSLQTQLTAAQGEVSQLQSEINTLNGEISAAISRQQAAQAAAAQAAHAQSVQTSPTTGITTYTVHPGGTDTGSPTQYTPHPIRQQPSAAEIAAEQAAQKAYQQQMAALDAYIRQLHSQQTEQAATGQSAPTASNGYQVAGTHIRFY